jgi:AraC family transcriptional regulator of adaptative response/methylated-DNA-[protein]-cysteine methyltransferase
MEPVEPGPDPTLTNPQTYECIAKAIAFMRQHHRSQPDLKTIAQQVHLSEYHFQRLFTTWAGISPKRFSQYLSLEYAKAKITETRNLLDLSLETGLSSPGRLHDLFVTLEAMSPGEFKAGGAGLQIAYGIHDTPFGPCVVATTLRGICNLHFLDCSLDRPNPELAQDWLRQQWSQAELVQDQAKTGEVCDRLFQPLTTHANSLVSHPLVVHVKGTNFQIQVWRALLQIPWGGLTTYQELGKSLGRPTAARAIGNAVGRNPVAYLIPCHRVIRASGELGGYRWGLERKTTILAWEASQTEGKGSV